jgi:hypothetical protein
VHASLSGVALISGAHVSVGTVHGVVPASALGIASIDSARVLVVA